MKTSTSIPLLWKSATLLMVLAMAFSGLQAQVVYKDLEPDFQSDKAQGRFALDLDGNGHPDFAIWLFLPVSPQTVLLSTFGENAVLAKSETALAKPIWLDTGDTISFKHKKWVRNTASSVPVMETIGENAGGMQRLFIGLSIMKKDGVHFGWVRIEVDAEKGQYLVMDYAYEKRPEVPIAAGEKGNPPVQASRVEKIHLAVVETEKGNPEMVYQFNPAPREDRVEEYQVMVVEQELASRFDEKVAKRIGGTNVLVKKPASPFYSGKIPLDFKTVSGQAVQRGTFYHVYVLSKAPGVDGKARLSPPSNVVLFEPPVDSLLILTEDLIPGVRVVAEAPRKAASQTPRKDYPKLRKGDYRLYGAGNKVIFKSNLESVDPESTITVYSALGRRLGGRTFYTPETELVLDKTHGGGVFLVKVNVNGTLINREIYLR